MYKIVFKPFSSVRAHFFHGLYVCRYRTRIIIFINTDVFSCGMPIRRQTFDGEIVNSAGDYSTSL